MLLLPSSLIVEPPHSLSEVATCPMVGTVLVDVDVDDVISDPTATNVTESIVSPPAEDDFSTVLWFAPPSSVASANLITCEYVPPCPAVKWFSDTS